jgi:hypothetical protein
MAPSFSQRSLDRRPPRIRIVASDHLPDRFTMGMALATGQVRR